MKGLNRCIAAMFSGLVALILSVLFICFKETAFAWKREFVLPQWIMLLCGATVLGCFGMLLRNGIEKLRKWSLFAPWIAGAALLSVQLVICFHAYFITGWDVRSITESAYAFAGGESDYHSAYLSMYHNNIPITLFFAAIIRVLRFIFGNIGMDRCMYVLIAGQCILNTVTGLLCFFVAQRLAGSRRFAWYTLLVYVALVGLSPWLMIPYTDSMSLLFPTAIIAVYLLRPKGWGRGVKWLAIGLLSGLGYLIKVQAVIVTIAIVLIESFRAIQTRRLCRGGLRLMSIFLLMGILVGPVKQILIDITPANIRPHLAMTMPHYAMMGLNRNTNGCYDYDDLLLSLSAPNVEERIQLQLGEIKDRWSEMTTADLLDHFKKKTLTIYADGTFAWACEGEFYREWIDDKDDVLSPFLKSLVDVNSDRFIILLTIMHSIWLALLAGCVICGFRQLLLHGERYLDVLSVMMLAVVGLILFEWIFEARARYLYLYAPYFVMLGTYGWWYMLANKRFSEDEDFVNEE